MNQMMGQLAIADYASYGKKSSNTSRDTSQLNNPDNHMPVPLSFLLCGAVLLCVCVEGGGAVLLRL